MLNPVQILKRSSRLTLVNAAGVGLNFLAAAIVANRLGPDLFGRISFVLLWVNYASLARPGIFEGGQRQLIHHLGTGDFQGARKGQNVGFSVELLWGLIPAVVLLAASSGTSDHVIRVGFVLAPLMYMAQGVSRMLSGLFVAHQEFSLYTTAVALRAFVQPVAILTLLHLYGPYALVITPALVECLIAAFYVLHARSIDLSWSFDLKAAIGLMKTGFPLSLAAIIYWLYRLAGTTSVALALSAAMLGTYSFGSRIIDLVLRLFADFSNFLMPGLWRELAKRGSVKVLWPEIVRINLFLAFLSCLICNLIQASITLPVLLLLPRFSASIAVIQILAFNIVLITLAMTPGILLDSALLNRQWLHLGLWTGGMLINYAVNIGVLKLGFGITAIAWNDIWVQVGVVILILAVTHNHVFPGFASANRLYIPLVGLLTICVGVYMALSYSLPALSSCSIFFGCLVPLFLRVGFVSGVWAVVGLGGYRLYRNTLRHTVESALAADSVQPN